MKVNKNKLVNCRVFLLQENLSEDFIGNADEVDLPDMKTKDYDAAGLGLYVASKLSGQLEALTARVHFNSIYPHAIPIICNPRKSATIICYGSMEVWGSEGVSSEQKVKAEIKGLFNETNPGKFKVGDPTTMEAKMNVNYFKLTIADEELLEIDAWNNVLKISGVDLLEQFRENIGG